MRTLTLVLVGPMTGIEDFDYPAFRDAAARLRAAGFAVIDPSENPAPVMTEIGLRVLLHGQERYLATRPAETVEHAMWRAYLRMSLSGVLRADAVATLPGYSNSRGARLALHLARGLHMPEFSVDAWLAKADFDAKHAAASGW